MKTAVESGVRIFIIQQQILKKFLQNFSASKQETNVFCRTVKLEDKRHLHNLVAADGFVL